MDELGQAALDAAIDKEFAWRMNTYGMVRWGLSAFKQGWAAGATNAMNPHWNGVSFPSAKASIWERGKQAYHAYAQKPEKAHEHAS